MEKELPKLSGEKPKNSTEKWHEFDLQRKFNTPARLEDVAKYLASMISISLTIFLIGGNEALINTKPVIIKIIGVSWFLSLLFSFLVVFPKKYTFSNISAEYIEKSHERIIKFKYRMLVISVILFVISIGLLFLRFIVII